MKTSKVHQKYMFRDKSDDNGEDNLFYYAYGLVETIENPVDENKAYTVRFIDPYTGDTNYAWRGCNEVELLPVSDHQWEELKDIINKLEQLYNN